MTLLPSKWVFDSCSAIFLFLDSNRFFNRKKNLSNPILVSALLPTPEVWAAHCDSPRGSLSIRREKRSSSGKRKQANTTSDRDQCRHLSDAFHHYRTLLTSKHGTLIILYLSCNSTLIRKTPGIEGQPMKYLDNAFQSYGFQNKFRKTVMTKRT